MENEPFEKPQAAPETTTLREETRRVEAVVAAHQATMAAVLLDYRMVSIRRPFSGGTFNHLRHVAETLTMCDHIRTESGGPVDLAEVDCIACLDAFTERTRP
jgi:hypothetical protein